MGKNSVILSGFNIKELVDQKTYEMLGEEAWKLFDERTLITLDKLKKLTGWTIIANTWSFKSKRYGSFSQRGYRNLLSGVGAKGGSHYLGMGVDVDCYDKLGRIEPDVVRKFILNNISEFDFIRCLEIDINWVHIDVMGNLDHVKRAAITNKRILLYSPKGNTTIIERKNAHECTIGS